MLFSFGADRLTLEENEQKLPLNFFFHFKRLSSAFNLGWLLSQPKQTTFNYFLSWNIFHHPPSLWTCSRGIFKHIFESRVKLRKISGRRTFNAFERNFKIEHITKVKYFVVFYDVPVTLWVLKVPQTSVSSLIINLEKQSLKLWECRNTTNW
jgi:hypothetical protein